MNKRFWILFVLIIGACQLPAQEKLLGLNQNIELTKHTSFKSTTETSIFLPFFDDFKQNEFQPNQTLWADNYVYVNTSFQKFPANLGVATFDAQNEKGSIYIHANSFSFIADYLTSNTIRLDSLKTPTRPIVKADSLYLSFYYQPQGMGNEPEPGDSLVLEFYSGKDQLWYRIWSVKGQSLESFFEENNTYCKQVLIPITDSLRFYRSDFRFRFYNYASLASPVQTSWQSNADQWNIDFVRLDIDRNRNDIYAKKLNFVNLPLSFLKLYRSMPYNQYKNDPTNSMADSLHSVLISNLDAIPYIATYQYTISDQSLQDSIYYGGSASINPFIFDGYSSFPRFKDPKVISFFALHPDSSKEYTIKHIVKSIPLSTENSIGDTLIQKQSFNDYFAYDDGSSEAGYGLSAAGNSAALKFKLNMADTLTEIKMYFNPTLVKNEESFYLKVWKSLDPEVLLYESTEQVKQADVQEGFAEYPINKLIVVSNEFFVGFSQTTENNLNVGFDLSYSPKESLYYNAGIGWFKSIYQGSLMMRPVFSNYSLNPIPTQQMQSEIQIFPNPLKSTNLTVLSESGQTYFIRIYNLVGKLVYSSNWQQQLNLDFLQRGVFVMQFENLQSGQIISQKLIKNQ